MNARLYTRSIYERAFTLIELILVVAVIGLLLTLVSLRTGAFDYWKEENAIRRLSETLVLLNTQAVMDQSFFRVEFDLQNRSYRVGVMRADTTSTTASTTVGLSPLSIELAELLSPDIGSSATMIPPPSFPSLAEPQSLPSTLAFQDIVTPRGKSAPGDSRENPFLIFSPKGTSEFGVIHLVTADQRPVTIFINPWTGLTEQYRTYKDFQWTLKREK